MENPKNTIMPSEPPKLSAILGDSIITVKVGPDQTNFHIHKRLLQLHSEYFTTALNGNWQEGDDGVVTLEDIEPKMFGVFAAWLYTKMIPASNKEWAVALDMDQDWDKIGSDTHTAIIIAHVRAYILGDRLNASEFCRAVHNNLIEEDLSPTKALYQAVILAFEHIPESKVMLQFMVDEHCSYWVGSKGDAEERELEMSLPYEFLRRVMRRFGEMKVKAKGRRCYREHSAEQQQECDDLHMRYDEEVDYGYFE